MYINVHYVCIDMCIKILQYYTKLHTFARICGIQLHEFA